jgi:uncharacterized membrane protein
MLSAFGVFWSGEGVGVEWPGADAALLGLIAFIGGSALAIVRAARRPVSIAASAELTR